MAGKKPNGDVKASRVRRGSSISQAIEKMDESLQKTENVFLFLPNLIGYTRIALAFASLQYMPMCVPIQIKKSAGELLTWEDTRAHARCCTRSRAFWTPRTAGQPASMISLRPLVPY